MEKHQGIRIDKIPVEGGAGLVFVLGILLIGLIAQPAIRSLALLAIGGGLVGAVGLRLWHKYH